MTTQVAQPRAQDDSPKRTGTGMFVPRVGRDPKEAKANSKQQQHPLQHRRQTPPANRAGSGKTVGIYMPFRVNTTPYRTSDPPTSNLTCRLSSSSGGSSLNDTMVMVQHGTITANVAACDVTTAPYQMPFSTAQQMPSSISTCQNGMPAPQLVLEEGPQIQLQQTAITASSSAPPLELYAQPDTTPQQAQWTSVNSQYNMWGAESSQPQPCGIAPSCLPLHQGTSTPLPAGPPGPPMGLIDVGVVNQPAQLVVTSQPQFWVQDGLNHGHLQVLQPVPAQQQQQLHQAVIAPGQTMVLLPVMQDTISVSPRHLDAGLCLTSCSLQPAQQQQQQPHMVHVAAAGSNLGNVTVPAYIVLQG